MKIDITDIVFDNIECTAMCPSVMIGEVMDFPCPGENCCKTNCKNFERGFKKKFRIVIERVK